MAEARQLILHIPTLAGDHELHVRRIRGFEGLSQLYEYQVTLLARSEEVDFSKILGEEMRVGLGLPGGERFFHGYVPKFAAVGSEKEFTVYEALLVPHLWRLTLNTRCRVYQGLSVTSIVEGILEECGIDIEAHYGGWERSDFEMHLEERVR